MATLSEIKTRLALIQPAISGVEQAYAEGPKALVPANMPLFVNLLGPTQADHKALGAEANLRANTILMRLYVCPIQQGLDGEAERLVEPLIPLVWACFDARPGLGTYGLSISDLVPLAGVRGAHILSDSGIRSLVYAGTPYLGVEFRLNVIQIVEVSYAPYE